MYNEIKDSIFISRYSYLENREIDYNLNIAHLLEKQRYVKKI